MVDAIFICATVVFLAALTPGPDSALILSKSLNHGVRAGLIATLGIAVGLLAHLGAVAFGLVQLFQLYPLSLLVLKWVGAAYLLWIAYHLILKAGEGIEIRQKRNEDKPFLHFKHGLLTNILNPKALIFFTSIFPQFVDLEAAGALSKQLFFLCLTALLSAMAAHSSLSIGGGLAKRMLAGKNNRVQKIQNYVLAFLFATFALNLILWQGP